MTHGLVVKIRTPVFQQKKSWILSNRRYVVKRQVSYVKLNFGRQFLLERRHKGHTSLILPYAPVERNRDYLGINMVYV